LDRIKHIIIILTCLLSITAYAQEPKDSVKIISLDEVLVTAENISRQGDHIVILPTKNQKDHSPTGYAFLYNLMIPGLTISDNGAVSTMGMNTGLYINGQPADVHDIVFLRPNEVEKVELYDFPTGKFSKDNMALNFVVKHYVYGGYLHLLGEQSLGINTGNYIASASLNRNSTTYSIFGGFNYSVPHPG